MPEWEAIVRRHSERVWQITRRVLGNEADAADCFQDVFAEAIRTIDERQAETIENWEAFLCRLATCRAVDVLRRRYRTAERRQTYDVAELPAKNPPAGDLELEELRCRLRAALAQLPANQAQAFAARELDQCSYEETAERLAISVSHARVLLHRARASLRTLLADLGPDQILNDE